MHRRPLYICIVTADFPGLTETFITNKVLELSKRGHRIAIIKNSNNGAINTSHLNLVKQANIEILTMRNLGSLSEIGGAVAHHPLMLLKSASTSAVTFKNKFKSRLQLELLTKHDFDIVHFEFSGLAVSYLDTIKDLKTKTVVSCRGTAEKVKPLTDKKRKENLKQLFSSVSAIHCVSNDMSTTVQKYGADKTKIFVNTPAIDASVFTRSKVYEDNNGELKILSIGRFTFQKGYLIGLMAMKELKNKGIKFKWMIVGDGPLSEEIIYHIEALSLHSNVELLGKKNRDEILSLYNEADVFLLPSVYEGIANVCLEAMAMELPVVSTKSGGMEEVIVHEQNGLLCEVYNPSDISEKLQLVAIDFSLRKQLGIKARETVVQNFNLQNQTDIFEEQYHLLVNN